MKKILLVVLQSCLAIWLAALCGGTANAVGFEQNPAVTFFDVSELPARIDEPRLRKSGKEFVLDCAIANRSGDPLLGIRLILLIIDPRGKLRSRITWSEPAELAMYSIKTFTFHPEITVTLRSSDRLFLGIDEVIGRETIWRAVGVEKALRAYAGGQHDVAPAVRAVANQFDPRRNAVMPIIR